MQNANPTSSVVSYGQNQVFPGQQTFRPPLVRQPRPLHQSQPPVAELTQHSMNNKKALIIGCNYGCTKYELKGCIHDARHVKHMLCTVFHFSPQNIRLLLDDGSGDSLPTYRNILGQMHWLVNGLKPGDSLFFHFSGHGSQCPDFSGDERDGLNETLLPCDFETAGQLVDDDINRIMINPLPRGVYLHAIIDACHSGTAMDLEFYTKLKNGTFEWRSEGPCRIYKGTSGGIAILFSACSDNETAQDTGNLAGGLYTGAATHSFIQAIVYNGPNQSYEQILLHMFNNMEKLTGHQYHKVGMVDKIIGNIKSEVLNAMGIVKQTPQLSCNFRLNLHDQLHI
eukprot:g7794.t1